MNVGEEKDIAATLPDDYPNEELRGRDVTYHLQAISMKEQQLPELDDEFTKTHGFDNVEALRETVDRNLKARAEEAAESNQVSEIIRQLVESSNVEVPDVMVNEELDAMLASLENRLREQRLTVRQYFTYSGLTEQEWRERSRDRARERVIQGLVLHDFAHAEDIEVGESEVEGEIEGMLGSFEGEEREKASSVLARSDTRRDVGDRLYQRKIVDRLIGIAEGRVVAKGPEQHAEAEAEAQEAEGPSASDIENAAGAAELLNTEEPHSANETGEAEGGGTPESAPAIEATRE
jgi:trigger factor